jgi:hypothetical protein
MINEKHQQQCRRSYCKKNDLCSLDSHYVSDLYANCRHHQEGLIDIQGSIKDAELAIFFVFHAPRDEW